MGDRCINCKKKINMFNETYPLWKNTDDRMCSTCKGKIEKYLVSLKSGTALSSFITIKKDIENEDLNQDGLDYIENYCVHLDTYISRMADEEAILIEKNKEVQDLINDMMITTSNSFEDYDIVKYHDIIFSETIFKTSLGKALVAELEDIGNILSFKSTELTGVTSVITEAKKHGKEKLKIEAANLGANAIVAIDVESSFGINGLTKVAMSGTAVTINKTNKYLE